MTYRSPLLSGCLTTTSIYHTLRALISTLAIFEPTTFRFLVSSITARISKQDLLHLNKLTMQFFCVYDSSKTAFNIRGLKVPGSIPARAQIFAEIV